MLKQKPVGSEKLEGKEKLQRILELTYKGLNESKEDKVDSDFLVKEGVDGKNYAIVKENSHYFIKISDSKEKLLKEDFQYIGGVRYNQKYKYNSFADALKGLNTFLYNLKESLDSKKEYVILENDRFVLRQPEPQTLPQPTSAPAPQPQGEQFQEPQPESMEDVPMDEPQPSFEDDEDSVIRQVQRLTGKLGQKIRDSYNSQEGFDDKMVKYVMNSIISAIRFENVNPQVKESLVNRINQMPEQNQEVPQEQPPVQGEPQPQMQQQPIGESEDLNEKLVEGNEIKLIKGKIYLIWGVKYEYIGMSGRAAHNFKRIDDDVEISLLSHELANMVDRGEITESKKGLPKIKIGGKTFLFETVSKWVRDEEDRDEYERARKYKNYNNKCNIEPNKTEPSFVDF